MKGGIMSATHSRSMDLHHAIAAKKLKTRAFSSVFFSATLAHSDLNYLAPVMLPFDHL